MRGAWCPVSTAKGEYIQVDLGKETLITKVATQGRPGLFVVDEWVTQYSLSYSSDNVAWVDYEGDCLKV